MTIWSEFAALQLALGITCLCYYWSCLIFVAPSPGAGLLHVPDDVYMWAWDVYAVQEFKEKEKIRNTNDRQTQDNQIYWVRGDQWPSGMWNSMFLFVYIFAVVLRNDCLKCEWIRGTGVHCRLTWHFHSKEWPSSWTKEQTVRRPIQLNCWV